MKFPAKIPYLLSALATLVSIPAHAGLQECLPQEKFRQLAGEIAPKVNLFAEAWKQDPKAEFYGGTTRDFLYWLKGKFTDCQSPKEAKAIIKELKSQTPIDVREFIIGDSDIDVVSDRYVNLRPERFGVRKFDLIKPDIFDPKSDRGKNEAVQGHVPAEKIRLQKDGLVVPREFGDGLQEIYTGKLTVHFTPPKVFAKGHYAKEGINHPILLALRYIRLLGIDYYRTNGKDFPNRQALFDIDPESRKAVKAVIDSVMDGRQELAPFLKKDQFKGWLNGTIQKSFRSYTNPDAVKALMEFFRVNELPKFYPEVEPLNQYLFAKHWDEKAIAKNFAEDGFEAAGIYLDPKKVFADGFLYHGTKTEAAFRGIILQGVLPSDNGSAGDGLYGVDVSNKAFSENWGNDPQRLIRFPVKENARIIDITEGEGKKLWDEFSKVNKLGDQAGAIYIEGLSEFAERYGADIIAYPYKPRAFIVKNSGALAKSEGVYRKILLLSEAVTQARAVKSGQEVRDLIQSIELNNFSADEAKVLFKNFPENWAEMAFGDPMRSFGEITPRLKTLNSVLVLDPNSVKAVFQGLRKGVEPLLEANSEGVKLLKAQRGVPIMDRFAVDAILTGKDDREIANYLVTRDLRSPFPYQDFLRHSWAFDFSEMVEAQMKAVSGNPGFLFSSLAKQGAKLSEFIAARPNLNFLIWQKFAGNKDFMLYLHGESAAALRGIEAVDPKEYEEGLKSFLGREPGPWLRRHPPQVPTDEHRALQVAYDVFLPRKSGDSFFRQPRATVWLEEFLKEAGKNYNDDTRKMVLNLIQIPEVARLPGAEKWVMDNEKNGRLYSDADQKKVAGWKRAKAVDLDCGPGYAEFKAD